MGCSNPMDLTHCTSTTSHEYLDICGAGLIGASSVITSWSADSSSRSSTWMLRPRGGGNSSANVSYGDLVRLVNQADNSRGVLAVTGSLHRGSGGGVYTDPKPVDYAEKRGDHFPYQCQSNVEIGVDTFAKAPSLWRVLGASSSTTGPVLDGDVVKLAIETGSGKEHLSACGPYSLCRPGRHNNFQEACGTDVGSSAREHPDGEDEWHIIVRPTPPSRIHEGDKVLVRHGPTENYDEAVVTKIGEDKIRAQPSFSSDSYAYEEVAIQVGDFVVAYDATTGEPLE